VLNVLIHRYPPNLLADLQVRPPPAPPAVRRAPPRRRRGEQRRPALRCTPGSAAGASAGARARGAVPGRAPGLPCLSRAVAKEDEELLGSCRFRVRGWRVAGLGGTGKHETGGAGVFAGEPAGHGGRIPAAAHALRRQPAQLHRGSPPPAPARLYPACSRVRAQGVRCLTRTLSGALACTVVDRQRVDSARRLEGVGGEEASVHRVGCTDPTAGQVVDELIRISDQQRRAIVAHLQRRSAAAAAAAVAHEGAPGPGPGPARPAHGGGYTAPVAAPPSRHPSVGALALLTPSLLRSPADEEPCLGTLHEEDAGAEAAAAGRGEGGGAAGSAPLETLHEGPERASARVSLEQAASAALEARGREGGETGAGPAGASPGAGAAIVARLVSPSSSSTAGAPRAQVQRADNHAAGASCTCCKHALRVSERVPDGGCVLIRMAR